jgi:hypothetical protein
VSNFIGFGRVFSRPDNGGKLRLTATQVDSSLGMDVNVLGLPTLTITNLPSSLYYESARSSTGATNSLLGTKIHLGALGYDDGPVRETQPFPVTDPEATSELQQIRVLLESINFSLAAMAGRIP